MSNLPEVRWEHFLLSVWGTGWCNSVVRIKIEVWWQEKPNYGSTFCLWFRALCLHSLKSNVFICKMEMVAFTSKCCIVWISWESVHQMPSTLITLSMLWFCFPFPFLARYDYVSHWQSWGRKWKWNGEEQSAHLVQEGTGCRKPASGQLQKEGHVQFYKSSFSYSSKPPQEPAGMITSNTWETRNGLSSKTTPYTHVLKSMLAFVGSFSHFLPLHLDS